MSLYLAGAVNDVDPNRRDHHRHMCVTGLA